MTMRNVYLKPNVWVEPLFNQWYAWTNLIAPATSSMYVANLHLKIMQSFVASPQLHVAALKNPANLGPIHQLRNGQSERGQSAVGADAKGAGAHH